MCTPVQLHAAAKCYYYCTVESQIAVCNIEVSDCEIFTHHDAWVVIYHDCENYPDCHIMQTFSVNKQAI